MLKPRSVAVLGASDDPTRAGGRPIAYMLERGFSGALFPVNPNRDAVQGLRAYARVVDLPEVPDLAIVALPAAQALTSIEELARWGVDSAVIFSSGFAETDQNGIELQNQIAAVARAHGMRLLGPNSLGLFNADVGFYGTFTASFETGWPHRGRIGIASQSGAFGAHVFCAARDRGLGASVFITTGNEADLTISDAIGWMAESSNVDVVVSYVEGIRDADSFIRALDIARRARKPIVMMKVGRSKLGHEAARSHTASIAGNDRVIDAVLSEFGVLRVRSTDEALDIAAAAARRIYPVHNTLGVLTVSGGAGILLADEAEDRGLDMPEMPKDAQARLRARLPFGAPRNPVDCTAQALSETSLIGEFGREMVINGGYRSILAFFSHAGGAMSIAPQLRRELKMVRDHAPDRLFMLSVLASDEIKRGYEEDGYLVYEDPTRAIRAIDAMGKFGTAFARRPSEPLPDVPAIALPSASLNEADAKLLLSRSGIVMAPETACGSEAEAVAAAVQFGFPVVMKILSPDIVHKSEIGGVLVGVENEDAVRQAYHLLLDRGRMKAPRAKIDGVLVAKQIEGGVECILGIQQDPVFGPIAMFGLGGIFVEIMGDVVLHRCPFGMDVAKDLINRIKSAPLLRGARGRPSVNIDALAAMLSRLSVIAAQAGPGLRSIDLNPVIATSEGAFAVDAAIEMQDLRGHAARSAMDQTVKACLVNKVVNER